MRFKGSVGEKVEILRDRAGVPHIYGTSTADVYFGLGLAMAQDRLWQMDRLRRRAMGRQAEILGPEYVRSDLMHLTVGIDRLAEADAARLDGSIRQLVEAFVKGINRWIEVSTDAGDLPPEFGLLRYAPAPFTVRDVVAILRGMWWSLNGRLEQLVATEAARLLPDEALRVAYLTPEAPEARIMPAVPVAPPGMTEAMPRDASVLAPLKDTLTGAHGSGDASGSNNWAVAGRRAAAGKAMLCSDPHQPFWLPSSWYEYAVHGPEDDAAGAGHPGVPGIWFGGNGDIAWGITNNASSTRDLYIEEVHSANAIQYREGSGWRRFDERVVTIPVRGEAPREMTLRATVRGPVMNGVLPSVAGPGGEPMVDTSEGGDPPLSLRWVGQEHLEDLASLVAIGRARDWNAFREALRGWSVPVFNFGYADATGRAGYQCAGRVPVRGRVMRGYRQASEVRDACQGYVPFDALPYEENPPRGYMASANNRAAPDEYPYPLYGAWAAGHRAVRLKQALEAPARTGENEGNEPFTRGQMVALQNDVKSCRAERLCPPLLDRLARSAGSNSATGAESDDPDIRLLRETLAAWDYRYTLESAAPLLFEAFMQAWQARVCAERFPSRLAPLAAAQGSAAALLIEQGQRDGGRQDGRGARLEWFAGGPQAEQDALIEAARQAVVGVRDRLGNDPAQWSWGAVHVAHWRHPLSSPETAARFDVGPVPVDGGVDTVRNTGMSSRFEASSGAEYRLVVDFALSDQIWAVQNVGNSGVPDSAHYADQLAPWLAGEYHVVHLRREGVEGDLESVTEVMPGD